MATHKELIKSLKFDKSFKNALRDYYSYGFKGLKDYDSKNVSTLSEDWQRLNNILNDYMKWSDEKDKKDIMYTSQDSLAMMENPFHRVYRFCKFNHNDPLVFFNIIFALSGKISISGTEEEPLYERLGIDLRDEAVKRNYFQYFDFFKENQNKRITLTKPEDNDEGICKLEADDDSTLFIPRKDEVFVGKLFKYWDFVNRHKDVHIKNGNCLVGYIDKKRETLEIPKGSMLEKEIAVNLIEGHGKIDQYEEYYISDIIDLLTEQFEKLLETISNKNESLSASQLQCFYPRKKTSLFTGDNNTINLKLDSMEKMCIVRKKTSGGVKEKIAENRYALENFVLEDIIECGKQATDGTEIDFETAFETAIEFFSRYHILGVCGTYIKDRLGNDNKSPFRFKHEYFMQALNDFNLIDLLYVIENEKWCEISYRHGTANFSTFILCKPLEIRVSSTSGRQFLMFYNPIKRSCSNLRLEFIEKIICYDEGSVLTALSKRNISANEIASDLVNAKQSLKYAWGVSISEKQEYNVVDPIKPKTVHFQVQYDKSREYYIRERMLRESRGNKDQDRISFPEEGIITFKAEISDPEEMRPWILSLSSRITSVSGIETEDYSFRKDLERCINGLKKVKEPEPQRWLNCEATINKNDLKNGEEVHAHENLFNEIFSVYYYIIAKVILCCCSDKKQLGIAKGDMDKILNETQRSYARRKGLETRKWSKKEIDWLIQHDAFGKMIDDQRIRFKYKCDPAIEFYRDIFPLTTLEIRWLKTVLRNSKMKYFLSDAQIKEVTAILDQKYPEIKQFPMESIFFYDRYKIHPKVKIIERKWISYIIKAISDETFIDISYVTRKRNKITGRFKPIVVEFSKRNNKFQTCFQSCRDGRIFYFNVSQFKNITLTGETFDHEEAVKQYEQYRGKNKCSVQIEFYDVRNLADRLLTEFSPWEKYCKYNSETKRYSLTIFYHKDDESDLVVRLMGYGAGIYVEKNHAIAREIRARFQAQLDLLKEQEIEIRM